MVVGSGFGRGQATLEAISAIEGADDVPYLVSDRLTESWIQEANPRARSLHHLYEVGKPRQDTYREAVGEILAPVRNSLRVCAVLYGHPGVFAWPGHQAIRQAREEGFPAIMCPGISAEDCLYADLGLDPAEYGCQSYEATNFVVTRRQIDNRGLLILWQAGVLGDSDFQLTPSPSGRLRLLIEALSVYYPADHACTLYEAAFHPAVPPRQDVVELGDLEHANLQPHTTLVIKPAQEAVADPALLELLTRNWPRAGQ